MAEPRQPERGKRGRINRLAQRLHDAKADTTHDPVLIAILLGLLDLLADEL